MITVTGDATNDFVRARLNIDTDGLVEYVECFHQSGSLFMVDSSPYAVATMTRASLSSGTVAVTFEMINSYGDISTASGDANVITLEGVDDLPQVTGITAEVSDDRVEISIAGNNFVVDSDGDETVNEGGYTLMFENTNNQAEFVSSTTTGLVFEVTRLEYHADLSSPFMIYGSVGYMTGSELLMDGVSVTPSFMPSEL